MIKHYCDRCEEEISTYRYLIEIKIARTGWTGTKSFEFCQFCKENLKKHVGWNKK
jgi:hypothetical protein